MRRLLACGALLFTACIAEPTPYRPPIPPAPEAVADRGRFLYQRDCAWCHGDDGTGTPRGPSVLVGTNGSALTDFMLRTGRMPVSSTQQAIRKGPPAYSEDEIGDLVAYVRSLGADGPAIPDADPARGDLALGAELYLENCAACHSTTGIGGTLTRDRSGRGGFVPGVRTSSAIEVAEAMRTGPGTMPVFPEASFSRHELDSIVRYVLSLQTPRDPGGIGAGHVGPVAEGAVAWIVGLGALLALAGWIGTSRAQQRRGREKEHR